jgi:hypothetical protein
VRSLGSVEKDGRPYSDAMDGIMCKHLLAEANPKITFRLTELVLKESPRTNSLSYLFDAKGELAVAGITNTISMPVSVTPLGNKRVKIAGTVSTKMTAFKITPPSPPGIGVFIKTGDEVRLFFEWIVAQKAAPAPSSNEAVKR